MFSGQKKEDVLDTPIPEEPADDAPAEEKTAYRKVCDNNFEISCLILACMEPDIQMQFETNHEGTRYDRGASGHVSNSGQD